MEGTSYNLLNCKIINFKKNSIDYLNGIKVNYIDPIPKLEINILNLEQTTCFRSNLIPLDFDK
jgi:hypothetical protein